MPSSSGCPALPPALPPAQFPCGPLGEGPRDPKRRHATATATRPKQTLAVESKFCNGHDGGFVPRREQRPAPGPQERRVQWVSEVLPPLLHGPRSPAKPGSKRPRGRSRSASGGTPQYVSDGAAWDEGVPRAVGFPPRQHRRGALFSELRNARFLSLGHSTFPSTFVFVRPLPNMEMPGRISRNISRRGTTARGA